eukprot:2903713-Amphidinium_carterae.3
MDTTWPEVYGSLYRSGECFQVKRYSMPDAATVLTLARQSLPALFEFVSAPNCRAATCISAILMSPDILDEIEDFSHRH